MAQLAQKGQPICRCVGKYAYEPETA